MDPKREYIGQEGSVVNWAQIHNQSLRVVAFHRKAGDKFQFSCNVFLPTEQTLIKEFLESSFIQWARIYPIQSELCSYTLIGIYNNQSEWLYNNQLECTQLTNQDSAIWTNQTMLICIPHLYKNRPISNQGRNFLHKQQPPLCLYEVQFQFSLEATFPKFANCSSELTFSFYHTPDQGLLLALDWWQPPFVDRGYGDQELDSIPFNLTNPIGILSACSLPLLQPCTLKVSALTLIFCCKYKQIYSI